MTWVLNWGYEVAVCAFVSQVKWKAWRLSKTLMVIGLKSWVPTTWCPSPPRNQPVLPLLRRGTKSHSQSAAGASSEQLTLLTDTQTRLWTKVCSLMPFDLTPHFIKWENQVFKVFNIFFLDWNIVLILWCGCYCAINFAVSKQVLDVILVQFGFWLNFGAAEKLINW